MCNLEERIQVLTTVWPFSEAFFIDQIGWKWIISMSDQQMEINSFAYVHQKYRRNSENVSSD